MVVATTARDRNAVVDRVAVNMMRLVDSNSRKNLLYCCSCEIIIFIWVCVCVKTEAKKKFNFVFEKDIFHVVVWYSGGLLHFAICVLCEPFGAL